MSSLFTNRSPLPGHSGLGPTGPLLSASFTYFEAFIPLRVRSRPSRVASWRSADALLSFALPAVFSKSALESLPARIRRPEHCFTRRIRSRLKGPCDPSCQVRTSPKQRIESVQSCSTASGPLRDRPAPPLGGVSSSHDLGSTELPLLCLALGVSECAPSSISPEGALTASRFVTFSTAS